ncbi:MAG: RNA polymerase subunit sigma-70 [Robiginitomaculum sp.]|nr:MAG: RNA polymerase subunit sigma-70 [Robiginitomaculum sp.]
MSKSNASKEDTVVASIIVKVFLKQEAKLKSFISRFVYRPQDVEDISQEVFIRAFKAEKTTDILKPEAFLFRIARNVAFNELKKKSNTMTDYIEDNSFYDVVSQEKHVDAKYEDQEQLRYFSHAVAELPARCQRVFIMSKVYGFTHKEIAIQLDISVSTVEKHVATGLIRCRHKMKERYKSDVVLDISKRETGHKKQYDK